MKFHIRTRTNETPIRCVQAGKAFGKMRCAGLAVALAWISVAGAGRAANQTIADFVGDRAPASIQRIMTSATPKNQQLPGLGYIADYEVIGGTIPLSSAQVDRLGTLLKNPASFTAGGKKVCGFRPGVAYRCGTGDSAIDFLVCFSCDEIAVVPSGGPIITSYTVPQPARDVLLALAKELLPKDEAIQALPKVRSEHPALPPPVPVPKDVPRPGQASTAGPAGT